MAQELAKRIREKDGGLKGVEALVLPYSFGRWEVACNLLKLNETKATDIEKVVDAWAEEHEDCEGLVEEMYQPGTTEDICLWALRATTESINDRNIYDGDTQSALQYYFNIAEDKDWSNIQSRLDSGVEKEEGEEEFLKKDENLYPNDEDEDYIDDDQDEGEIEDDGDGEEDMTEEDKRLFKQYCDDVENDFKEFGMENEFENDKDYPDDDDTPNDGDAPSDDDKDLKKETKPQNDW
jgi:hypothetical protein